MDPVIKGKFVYLNKEFFIVRTILYFAVWSFFGWLMRSYGMAWQLGRQRGQRWR